MSTKKKIGIITYWESNDNYGQQLQCWALQHVLRERGYDAFLIRQYAWPEQWKSKKKGIRRIKQWIKDMISAVLYATDLAYKPFVYERFSFCLNKEACRRQFPLFRKEHLKMTKIYDSPERLKADPPCADVYIAGSDQIWNYILENEPLQNYFLQFGDPSVKRIAYAPSLGRTVLPDKIAELYKVYLRKFSAISLREKDAAKLIQGLGYNVEHVLDPTLLLTPEAYAILSQGAESRSNVFIYSMNYSSVDDIPFSQIKFYAIKKNIPIIVTPGSGFVPAKELFDSVEYSYATIPQWIQHIANAELLITASFHGIVFAILFHRPFVFTPIKGEKADRNGRVLNLLDDLQLSKRILNEETTFDEIVHDKIDWQHVETKLKNLRQKSLNYLLTAIEI